MMSNIFLEMPCISFKCPYCSTQYDDRHEIYLKRVNKNKSCVTKKLCDCGNKMGITYDIQGDIVSFKLE